VAFALEQFVSDKEAGEPEDDGSGENAEQTSRPKKRIKGRRGRRSGDGSER
jgi:hypothetical protein